MNRISLPLYAAILGDCQGLAKLGDKSWDALAEQCRQEQMDGLLYRPCVATETSIPDVVLPGLQESYRFTAAHNFFALQEFGAVIEAMSEKWLEVLLLPGAALLPYYPDPGCRPMDDIDILVRPGEFGAVKAFLHTSGFLNPARYEDLFVRGDLTLDLHEDLLNCSRISARQYAGWMDLGAVWRDSRPVVIEGVSLSAMCREDMALYTTVHALRHGYSRFTWFLDLHFLLREDICWDSLLAKAKRYNLQRPMLYSMDFLSQWLHIDLPSATIAWRSSFKLSSAERYIMQKAFNGHCKGEWGDLLWRFNVAGLRRKFGFLVETLFPGPTVLLQVFPYLPKPLFPLAYGLRLGQLLFRGLRQLFRCFR